MSPPKTSHPLISPSLLAADFCYLADQVQQLQSAGVGSLHFDVIDGHFAPNFGFGPNAIASVRRITSLPLVVHLEIDCPDLFVESFIEAGADQIFFHPEKSKYPLQTIAKIASEGKTPGYSILPTTSISAVLDDLAYIPSVILLSVPPGFCGSQMDPQIFSRVKHIRRLDHDCDHRIEITVDGGVNRQNAPNLMAAGADILVCGTYIFSGHDPVRRVQELYRAFQEGIPQPS